jgi:hypothetical protein
MASFRRGPRRGGRKIDTTTVTKIQSTSKVTL